MEEDEKKVNPTDNRKFILTSVFLVMAVLLIGGAFYFLRNGNTKSIGDSDVMTQPMSDDISNIEEGSSESMESSVAGGENMESDASMSSQDMMTVEVEGGNYYFKPNEIKVKKDQQVKIIFNSVEGFHNFIIDEFNVKTDITPGGKTAEVTFIPDKAGTFEFYCGVANHRAMGMWGTLIVEE